MTILFSRKVDAVVNWMKLHEGDEPVTLELENGIKFQWVPLARQFNFQKVVKFVPHWVPISLSTAAGVIEANIDYWYRTGQLDDMGEHRLGRCPKCNNVDMLLALSRRDNSSMICDPCGTREAFEDMGM